MERLKEESDSDVEILEPEVLEDHYCVQQLRLITALSKSEIPIPKRLEDFQIFVQKILKFYLSPGLVRSVWLKLRSGPQLTNGVNGTCSVVEISDDEDDKQALKQHNEHLSYIGEVVHERLKPAFNGGNCSNKQWPDCVEISDDENTHQSHSEPNNISEQNDTSNQILERSFCVSNGRKRNCNGVRRSLPNSIDEEEAEALREKLLLDKIIELEIPQVIKSFLQKNNIGKNIVKKRRKSAKKRESIKETLPDNGIFPAANNGESIKEPLPNNCISPPANIGESIKETMHDNCISPPEINFIKNVLNLQLSTKLILSVWTELFAAEKLLQSVDSSGTKNDVLQAVEQNFLNYTEFSNEYSKNEVDKESNDSFPTELGKNKKNKKILTIEQVLEKRRKKRKKRRLKKKMSKYNRELNQLSISDTETSIPHILHQSDKNKGIHIFKK